MKKKITCLCKEEIEPKEEQEKNNTIRLKYHCENCDFKTEIIINKEKDQYQKFVYTEKGELATFKNGNLNELK